MLLEKSLFLNQENKRKMYATNNYQKSDTNV